MDQRINLKDLDVECCHDETLKEQLNISEMGKARRVLCTRLLKMSGEQMLDVIKRSAYKA